MARQAPPAWPFVPQDAPRNRSDLARTHCPRQLHAGIPQEPRFSTPGRNWPNSRRNRPGNA
eukprot:11194157-Lingulodinium_polyedra.AAC.1